MNHRRRGTAIVQTNKGILLTAGIGKIFITPGGGADKHESRMQAAIRELKEETGVEPYFAMLLFSIDGPSHRTFQDHHTVYFIKASGEPKPKHEIEYVGYYFPGCGLTISQTTKEIIERYYEFKRKHMELFDQIEALT